MTDPATGQVLTTVAEAGAGDVDAAVQAAREASDAGEWSGLSGRERGRVLHRIAELIRENAEEIAALESLDLRLVREGRLPLHRLISTYPFAEIDRAVRDMSTGKAIKPVLTF